MRILIAGQGLAGSILAMQLLEKGVQVLVAGKSLPGEASSVAAGVFNPVTGRKPVETWLAPVLFPFLQEYYPRLERALGARFFFPLPNFRPLQTGQERSQAAEWVSDAALARWATLAEPGQWAPGSVVHAPFGGLLVRESGYVEVGTLVSAARRYFRRLGIYREAEVSEQDLTAGPEGIAFQGGVFDKVLFCTGKWAPLPGLAPLKGEILRLSPQTGDRLAVVVNRAGYVAPREDGTWWAGSTYQHFFSEEGPTEAGKADILTRIGRSILVPVTVQEHLAGIRPSVKDRRPLVGLLRGDPRIGHFNGLGTKGVSLAPYMARLFCDHLLEGAPLPPEVDVNRFAGP